MDPREQFVREQRARVWDGMKAITEAARNQDGTFRALTEQEGTEYNSRKAELNRLDGELDTITRANRVESGHREANEQAANRTGATSDEIAEKRAKREAAFNRYLRRLPDDVTADIRSALSESPRYERRDNVGPDGSAQDSEGGGQTSGTGANGGYLVAQGFWHNLQIALRSYGGLQSLCNQIETASGNAMPWPTVNPTAVTGAIIGKDFGTAGEQSQQVPFQTYAFGQGLLQAWTFTSKMIPVSFELAQDTAFDLTGFVSDRIAEAIGRRLATALESGSGTNEPLGIVTALDALGSATVGTSGGTSGGVYTPATGGHVQTLGETTPTSSKAAGYIGFDDILNMMLCVDPAYRTTATWVVNDLTLNRLRMVTDAYGHPLWDPSVQNGGADLIYGKNVVVDNYLPAITTAGSGNNAASTGNMLFGDFKRAVIIRQVQGGEVMTLKERYADFLAIGYMGYMRLDARSNDLRAAVAWASPAS